MNFIIPFHLFNPILRGYLRPQVVHAGLQAQLPAVEMHGPYANESTPLDLNACV